MNHPYMFVAGCFMIGYFIPEIFAVSGKVKVPLMMNIAFAIAVALISASFVL